MKTINDLFKMSRQEWLDDARVTARKLLSDRNVITIEDVLQACPRPSYLHRNVTGSVFSSSEFKSVGFTTSKRRVSHGRAIRMWTLNERPLITVNTREYADVA